MFVAQAVARHQIAAARGGKQMHLLSVRSQLGIRGRGYSAYCSTKGGLLTLIQISIALAAITILTRNKGLQYVAYGTAAVAIAIGALATAHI